MSKKQPNTSRWTMRKYLTEVYIPQKRASVGLTDGTAEWYLHVATSLRTWRGRDVLLRELNAEARKEFSRWCVDRGCKARTVQCRIEVIMLTLRHWRPDEHPKPRKGNVPMGFMESDVAGTLEQICKDHYFPENTKIGSPQTVKQYGRCLRKFSEFLGHAATPADLTDLNLGRFLRKRVVDGLKARSANGEAKQLKALWNWLAKKRIVDAFPTIGKLTEAEVVPSAYTREQLEQLIAACKRQAGNVSRVDAAGYWLAFHLMIWDTGERTGALVQLAWPMLDFKTGCLTVPAEVRKSKQKAMVYRLKPATIAALKTIRSYSSKWSLWYGINDDSRERQPVDFLLT